MFTQSFAKGRLWSLFLVCFGVANAHAMEPGVNASSPETGQQTSWFDTIFAETLSDYTQAKECIAYASKNLQLDKELLIAVLLTERGGIGQWRKNNDGTHDLGPYQINEKRLPEIKHLGVDAQTLASDACVNAYVAAYLLKQELNEADEFWTGVGNYHYGEWGDYPKHHYRYINKVYENWTYLLEKY